MASVSKKVCKTRQSLHHAIPCSQNNGEFSTDEATTTGTATPKRDFILSLGFAHSDNDRGGHGGP
jgi:hypothetical protein